VKGAILTLLLCACGANATVLTATQEKYLQVHPELGPHDRNALLYRHIHVGETLERVKVAWDGLLFRQQPPTHQPVMGEQLLVPEIDNYEVFVPTDGRPVVMFSGAFQEEVPRGRVLLTFKKGILVTFFRLE
jgi:hypothetical protein